MFLAKGWNVPSDFMFFEILNTKEAVFDSYSSNILELLQQLRQRFNRGSFDLAGRTTPIYGPIVETVEHGRNVVNQDVPLQKHDTIILLECPKGTTKLPRHNTMYTFMKYH